MASEQDQRLLSHFITVFLLGLSIAFANLCSYIPEILWLSQPYGVALRHNDSICAY